MKNKLFTTLQNWYNGEANIDQAIADEGKKNLAVPHEPEGKIVKPPIPILKDLKKKESF